MIGYYSRGNGRFIEIRVLHCLSFADC